MTVKEDFVSLFIGHEAEISSLIARFLLRDFTYMITSQRTMDMIQEKLSQIVGNRAPIDAHQNFWADLQIVGLIKRNPNRISDFGRVVYAYFQEEENPFKREHFILSSIKDRKYDIDADVQQIYRDKVQELTDCFAFIPILNRPGNELLNNPEKLLITGFLNVFPYALQRYYGLPPDRQAAIESLHEGGLERIFDQNNPGEMVYYKIARRLLNNWRALDRRINFVKSVILSKYEDTVEQSAQNQIPYTIDPAFDKILNENILNEIISKSNVIQTDVENENHIIRKKYRDVSHVMTIENLAVLDTDEIRNAGNEVVRRITSADEQREAQERTNERTRLHENIVRLVAEHFPPNEGYVIKTDPANFDLLIQKENIAILFEIKTISKNNRSDERKQIRIAVGQLFYYEYMVVPSQLLDLDKRVIKFLVLQRKPIDNRHVNLLKNIGIEIIWLNDDGAIIGEEGSIEIFNNF